MKFIQLLVIGIFMTSFASAEQKVVLISGASSGIGLAAAKAFYEDGWKVWAGYRTSIPQELQNFDQIQFCKLDITDSQLVNAAVKNLLQKGRIDVLVNNAGYGLIGSAECVTMEEAEQVFDVNFFGALRLIQAVLPTMREQKNGHIINISSGAGIVGKPGLDLYAASKFALEGLSESMAATLAQWNIQVSVVEPGFVQTKGGQNCIYGSRPCEEKLYSNLSQGWKKMLASSGGQAPEAVGQLLVEIANNCEPNSRYQTTPESTAGLSEIFVDPSGNCTKDKNLQLLNWLIQEPTCK
ncbi:MAG: 3-phenylpropionate-dihydrodiol/cinnamic acid-dihydrodiol dehydrogenase [Chlamydiales bacterium]|nr:3-phenylpropionate-dihydrodiol/cinnamic acid-dihydrodiol dehydrogenase [Chlamydiales bacterium]